MTLNMNISCPACSTVFIIEDHAIVKLKKLKCSKCKHIWVYESEEDLNVEKLADLPGVNKIKAAADLDSLNQTLNSKISKILYIYPIVVGFLVAMMAAINIIGFDDVPKSWTVSESIILKDVQLKNLWKEKKIVLNYRVYNNGDNLEYLPMIKIRLFDKNGKVLKTHIIKDKKELKQTQFVNINTEFESVMHEAYKVDIALGTWFTMLIW